jgi:hypothetical protein
MPESSAALNGFNADGDIADPGSGFGISESMGFGVGLGAVAAPTLKPSFKAGHSRVPPRQGLSPKAPCIWI